MSFIQFYIFYCNNFGENSAIAIAELKIKNDLFLNNLWTTDAKHKTTIINTAHMLMRASQTNSMVISF